MTTNTEKTTAVEVTENTPVTVTMPLGLLRATVVALAVYAGTTEHSRRADVEAGNTGEHDEAILRLLGAANNAMRDAARPVEPGFDVGAALSWGVLAGPANVTMAQYAREGKLEPDAIAELLSGQKERAAAIIEDVKASGGKTVGDLLEGVKRNAESSKGKTLH